MKKKIINGILMVALVAATSTSFVSCKDNSEDVRTDLMAQITKARTDLEPRVQQAENDIDALEGRMGTAETDLSYLKGRVAGIRDTLNSLETFRDSVYEVTQSLDKRLTNVEYKIGTIVKTLENLITSVTVNATSTSILENSKVFPGLNMQFLGAAYGKAEAETNFPNVAANELADGIKKYPVENGQTLIGDENAAGTIYFTVNPSNIDASNLEKVQLSLVNSQAEEILVLGEVKKSEKVLTWGSTRADGDATLWEAPVAFKDNIDALGKLEPAKMINLEQVANDVKAIVNEAQTTLNNVNRSNYSSTASTAAKNILKNASKAIADLIQVKVPSLPALALKAQWEDTVGVRSVLSDYSIAATAYKPVSFTWGKSVFNEKTISLDKIDDLAERIVAKIKAQEPNMDKYKISKVAPFNFSQLKITVEKLTDAGVTGVTKDIIIDTKDLTADANIMANTLNDDLDILNDAISDVKDIINNLNKGLDKGLNFEDRVTNALQRYINRVISNIANNGFYQALQPVLLVDTENGAARVVSGATLKAGETVLVPTTITSELLAPAFKKYVAVVNASGVKGEVKTKGDADFSKFTVTLAKGKNTIIYSALDFYGNEIVKRYTVTAE